MQNNYTYGFPEYEPFSFQAVTSQRHRKRMHGDSPMFQSVQKPYSTTQPSEKDSQENIPDSIKPAASESGRHESTESRDSRVRRHIPKGQHRRIKRAPPRKCESGAT